MNIKRTFLFLMVFAMFGLCSGSANAEIVSLNGISVKMNDISANLSFPTGTSDDGTGDAMNKYLMEETLVSLDSWVKIHDWATEPARGEKRYFFDETHKVKKDSDGNVTNVSWGNAILFCNAATEYLKGDGKNYTVVYRQTNAHPIRDIKYFANHSSGSDIDINLAATGFRLPTYYEWEFAARYNGNKACLVASCRKAENGYYWTAGRLTVSELNRSSIKTLVKLSSNVQEWVFGYHNPYVTRGGDLQIGSYQDKGSYNVANDKIGFRLAKNVRL